MTRNGTIYLVHSQGGNTATRTRNLQRSQEKDIVAIWHQGLDSNKRGTLEQRGAGRKVQAEPDNEPYESKRVRV